MHFDSQGLHKVVGGLFFSCLTFVWCKYFYLFNIFFFLHHSTFILVVTAIAPEVPLPSSCKESRCSCRLGIRKYFGAVEFSRFPHYNQVYVTLSQIWHLFILPGCRRPSCPMETARVLQHKDLFHFQKGIICFCVKYQHFFWKVLLLSFSILFLPTMYFHSAFVRSFMIFIWSLQGNLLPSQTKSKSKATLRKPWWMKLQYNCIMLRIMIPLQVSMEIRSTSPHCRIFILFTFLIDFPVLESCFIEVSSPSTAKCQHRLRNI